MIKFDISRYRGIGISNGLERGLLVYNDGKILLEEGMGIGACALQKNGYTYFTSITGSNKGDKTYEIEYVIDKKLVWTVWGIRSVILTRFLENFVSNIYMKHEKGQRYYLKLGAVMKKLFNISASYADCEKQGEITVKYNTSEDEVLVDISCETSYEGIKLFIMNELGATIFNKSIINDVVSEAPTGWMRTKEQCELYGSDEALAFSIAEQNIPRNVKSKISWGREYVRNQYSWAGFESEIVCNSNKFDNYSYIVKFREVN